MRPLTQARFQCDADLAGNLECTNRIHRPSRGELHKQDSGESVYVYRRIGDQGSEPVLERRSVSTTRDVKSYGISSRCHNHQEDNQACVYAPEISPMTRGMRHLDLAELLIKEKMDAKEIQLL